MPFHRMGVDKVLGKVPFVGSILDAPYKRMVRNVSV